MKKEYFIDDNKVEVFLIKTDKYSELKFFVNGDHHYTISNGSFEKIVNSIEHSIKTFNESHFNKNTLVEAIKDVELYNKLKSLGFN